MSSLRLFVWRPEGHQHSWFQQSRFYLLGHWLKIGESTHICVEREAAVSSEKVCSIDIEVTLTYHASHDDTRKMRETNWKPKPTGATDEYYQPVFTTPPRTLEFFRLEIHGSFVGKFDIAGTVSGGEYRLDGWGVTYVGAGEELLIDGVLRLLQGNVKWKVSLVDSFQNVCNPQPKRFVPWQASSDSPILLFKRRSDSKTENDFDEPFLHRRVYVLRRAVRSLGPELLQVLSGLYLGTSSSTAEDRQKFYGATIERAELLTLMVPKTCEYGDPFEAWVIQSYRPGEDCEGTLPARALTASLRHVSQATEETRFSVLGGLNLKALQQTPIAKLVLFLRRRCPEDPFFLDILWKCRLISSANRDLLIAVRTGRVRAIADYLFSVFHFWSVRGKRKKPLLSFLPKKKAGEVLRRIPVRGDVGSGSSTRLFRMDPLLFEIAEYLGEEKAGELLEELMGRAR